MLLVLRAPFAVVTIAIAGPSDPFRCSRYCYCWFFGPLSVWLRLLLLVRRSAFAVVGIAVVVLRGSPAVGAIAVGDS